MQMTEAQSAQEHSSKEHMVPSWISKRETKSPTRLAQDLQQHKDKWESEKNVHRQDEKQKLKLPSLHHLFDETSFSTPPLSAPFLHKYPPYKSTQPFHSTPQSKAQLSSVLSHDLYFDNITQKEASDLSSLRHHNSHQPSYPFGSLPPSPPSSHYPHSTSHSHIQPQTYSHSHTSYPPNHRETQSQSRSLLSSILHPPDASDDPYFPPNPSTLFPRTSVPEFPLPTSLPRALPLSHRPEPPHARFDIRNYHSESQSPWSDTRNHHAEPRNQHMDTRNRNVDVRNHHLDTRSHHSDSNNQHLDNNRSSAFKNVDVDWSYSHGSRYPHKFHPGLEGPSLKDVLSRNEKPQAAPGTPSPLHATFPNHQYPLLPRRPPPTASSHSHPIIHAPQPTPTPSRPRPLSPASHPTYGEFEENEYNLRAKIPSNPPPPLSPEQKRRRKIINKALSKGQMLARGQTPAQDTQARADAGTLQRVKEITEINNEVPRTKKRRTMDSKAKISRRCQIALMDDPSKLVCKCENPPNGTAVECVGCEKWYHIGCTVSPDNSEFVCTSCRSENRKKARAELNAVPKETSETTDPLDMAPTDAPSSSSSSPSSMTGGIEEETGGGIRVGNEVVSLSTLAKQPWIDGWATARVLAVQYLQEAKKLGNEITESRKLPKQISVRMSTKGKRPWRQAEVLLAIQFLKTSELVETSTRKGTLVKEPFKTMDDLIARALVVPMPSTLVTKSKEK